MPCFQGENFARNIELVRRVEALAKEKRCTPAQLALAWALVHSDEIVPLPGTKRRKYLEEDAAALDVTLMPEDLARLDELMPQGISAGARYPGEMMRALNRYWPRPSAAFSSVGASAPTRHSGAMICDTLTRNSSRLAVCAIPRGYRQA